MAEKRDGGPPRVGAPPSSLRSAAQGIGTHIPLGGGHTPSVDFLSAG